MRQLFYCFAIVVLLAAVMGAAEPSTVAELQQHVVDIMKTGKADGSSEGVLVKLSAYPDALCLDGTPAAYYLYPGKNTDKIIFFMQGGGLCTEGHNCYTRSLTPLGSSNFYPLTSPSSDLTGSLMRECLLNPTFCDYTVVYLNYCDGTVYSGALDGALNYQNHSLYLKGNNILYSALESLKPAMEVYMVNTFVLSGCSAGGLATFLHSDQVIAWVTANVPTVLTTAAVPLSGFFLLHPNILGATVAADLITSMLSIANGTHTLKPDCLASLPADEQWKCGFAEYAYNFTSVPTYVFNSKTDAFQIECMLLATATRNSTSEMCLGVPGYVLDKCPELQGFPAFRKCSTGQMAPILDYQGAFLDRMTWVQGFLNPDNGAFIDSCYTHCQGTSNGFWGGFEIGGTWMHEALDNWWSSVIEVKTKNRVAGVTEAVGSSSSGNPNIYIDCNRTDAEKPLGYECNLLCTHPLLKKDAMRGVGHSWSGISPELDWN